MKFNKNYNGLILPVLIFLLVFFFSWWSNPSLEGRIYPDTYDYINLAEDLSHPSNSLRPFLYPILIRGAMKISPDNWSKLIVLMQMLFHVTSILLIYRMLLKYSNFVLLSFIFSLAIGINPNLLYFSSAIIPTQLFGCFLVINLFLFLSFWNNYKKTNNVWNKYFFIFGLFSAFTVTLRSMYFFGIIPFVISMIILKMRKNIFFPIVILILLHLSVNTVWNQYKIGLKQEYQYGEKGFHPIKNTLLKTGGSWANMAAIRGGMVDYGKGTKLYKILEDKNLLYLARECKNGDYTEEFHTIYKELTFQEKSDQEFSAQILKSHPFKIILIQLSNWHEFFNKRMFTPNPEKSFPIMHNYIRYLYVGSYNNLYRPFMSILLLMFIILMVTKRIFNPLTLTGCLLVLFFSLGIALFSLHPGLFIYYRTAIEYILFICVFFPVIYIRSFLYKKMYLTTKMQNN